MSDQQSLTATDEEAFEKALKDEAEALRKDEATLEKKNGASLAPKTKKERKEKSPAAEKRVERQAQVDAETAEAGAALVGMADAHGSSMVAFSPDNFDAAWKLAHYVSKSGIVADGLKGQPGAVMAVMAAGENIGIHWSVAVQKAYVVYGRVGWPADLLAAVCDRDFEYFDVVECSNSSATVEAKRVRWSEPRRYSVTIEDAKAMGFMDGKHSQLWASKRPQPMLIAMVRREAARLWHPKLAGIHTPDELEAIGKPPAKNVSPTVAEAMAKIPE